MAAVSPETAVKLPPIATGIAQAGAVPRPNTAADEDMLWLSHSTESTIDVV